MNPFTFDDIDFFLSDDGTECIDADFDGDIEAEIDQYRAELTASGDPELVAYFDRSIGRLSL